MPRLFLGMPFSSAKSGSFSRMEKSCQRRKAQRLPWASPAPGCLIPASPLQGSAPITGCSHHWFLSIHSIGRGPLFKSYCKF